MTAIISYLGKNIPSEADLIVEYDNIPGIQTTVRRLVGELTNFNILLPFVDFGVNCRRERSNYTY
jgi:hypothetical protein